jgi:hypothetical protein
MWERTRRSSVPQIFINGTHVGGYDDLVALDRGGGLKPLLEGDAVSGGRGRHGRPRRGLQRISARA